jgi:hypothetical protein
MTANIETLGSPSPGAAVARTMTAVLAWFFVALALVAGGALVTTGGPPIALAIAMAVPLLAYRLDGRRGHPLLDGIARLDVTTLAVLQTFRVVGVVFLVAWWRGALPAGFALPAGLGDVTVGITAPFVAAALASNRPFARRLFVAWNVFGIVDLVTAVTLGVAHSRTAIGFIHAATSTDALAAYPFGLIPTFAVPLAIILHGVGLAKARSMA